MARRPLAVLQMALAAPAPCEPGALLVLNGSSDAAEVTLPAPPAGARHRLRWDSAHDRPQVDAGSTEDVAAPARVTVAPGTLRLYATA